MKDGIKSAVSDASCRIALAYAVAAYPDFDVNIDVPKVFNGDFDGDDFDVKDILFEIMRKACKLLEFFPASTGSQLQKYMELHGYFEHLVVSEKWLDLFLDTYVKNFHTTMQALVSNDVVKSNVIEPLQQRIALHDTIFERTGASAGGIAENINGVATARSSSSVSVFHPKVIKAGDDKTKNLKSAAPERILQTLPSAAEFAEMSVDERRAASALDPRFADPHSYTSAPPIEEFTHEMVTANVIGPDGKPLGSVSVFHPNNAVKSKVSVTDVAEALASNSQAGETAPEPFSEGSGASLTSSKKGKKHGLP